MHSFFRSFEWFDTGLLVAGAAASADYYNSIKILYVANQLDGNSMNRNKCWTAFDADQQPTPFFLVFHLC